MCAGAILQSRIKRVVFGARSPLLGNFEFKLWFDFKLGSAGSWINILDHENEKLIVHPFHSFLEVNNFLDLNLILNLVEEWYIRRWM